MYWIKEYPADGHGSEGQGATVQGVAGSLTEARQQVADLLDMSVEAAGARRWQGSWDNTMVEGYHMVAEDADGCGEYAIEWATEDE